jgi:hypothetical protein
VARAGHRLRGNPLFYEAASRAFRRVSGNDHAFWDALEARGLNMIDSAAFDEVKVARIGSARPWYNQITERAANGLMPVRAPAEWSTCFSYPQFRCKEAAEPDRTA